MERTLRLYYVRNRNGEGKRQRKIDRAVKHTLANEVIYRGVLFAGGSTEMNGFYVSLVGLLHLHCLTRCLTRRRSKSNCLANMWATNPTFAS